MVSAEILLLTCFHISAAARGLPRPAIAPAYRIDLRSVVKGPFVFEPIGPGGEARVGLPIRSLRFLDNQRLVVTVVTQAAQRPRLAARGEPSTASAFRLNAVLIKAATGKILGTPAWPSNSRYAMVVAVNEKGLVTEAGTEFTLRGLDLRLIRRIVLPPLPSDKYAHDNYWEADSSWSGKRLLLTGGRVSERGPWLWLDAENLRVLRSWEGVQNLPLAVSDRKLVMGTDAQHFGDPPPFLQIATPGGSWMPLSATVNPSGPQFVAPGLLYFSRYTTIDNPHGGGVFLMHMDGGEASRLEPPHRGWGLGRAATSRAGNRFVILVEQTKGSHPALDIGGHTVLRGLLVYDPPFIVHSRTLEIRGSRIRNPANVALSPDGRHLAVLAYPKPVLEVYDLPPANGLRPARPRSERPVDDR